MRFGVLGAVCALVIAVYAGTAHSGLLESLSLNAADGYYNLLVQGFRAGQLSLKKEAPPGFAQLADPYDPITNRPYRLASNRLHDLAYYKGRLYLDFGVTPVLILFWPFVALTGRYIFDGQAVAIFCTIGFLTTAGLLRALWQRYFPKVSIRVVAAGALPLGLATLAPVILPASDVYEVAISCGYMLTMLALAAIWKSLHEPERSGRWLAAASVAYGLAVGARPNLLFGAVILLVPVVQAWRERRQIWTVLVAAMGPIVLIGLGLMIYNELRFDNPFEFGKHYVLREIRQATQQFFSPRYFWFNFRAVFLEPAHWSSRFPFVEEVALPAQPSGHWPVESPFGILTNIPLVWLALAVPLAWRGRSAEVRSALGAFTTGVALFFGICALTICFFCQATCRYEVEFLPALVLLAVVGILGLERALAPTPTSESGQVSESGLADRLVWRRVARCGWGMLLVFSVAFNLFASVGSRAKAHYNLGNVLFHAGKVPEAIEQYERALRLRPDDAKAQDNLGFALAEMGKLPEAIGHYEQALRIKPDLVEAQNNLAWVLATLPPAEGGDSVRAVVSAQRACELSGNRVPGYLDTLAVAYAAAGRFDAAVATAQKAIDLARADGQAAFVKEIEARLELYRSGHAYRRPVDEAEPHNP
ncbi:MAG: tetratricopeptide repeat protein [Verrucomicrobiia bacterium]